MADILWKMRVLHAMQLALGQPPLQNIAVLLGVLTGNYFSTLL